jgi:hypothetical protein
MNTVIRTFAWSLSACLLASGAAHAQGACDRFMNSAALKAMIDGRLVAVLVNSSEQEAASLFKTVAPAPGGDGSTLVQGANFTRFVAVAVENELVQGGDGKTNIQFTPWAWATAFNPSLLEIPAAYDAAEWHRRFAISLSSGGEGEKFDRDGDGVADAPLKAEDFNDIQTYELKYRVFGSRDWKARRARIGAELAPFLRKAADAHAAFLFKLNHDVQQKAASEADCPATAEKLLNQDSAAAQLLEIGRLQAAEGAAWAKQLVDVKRSWITSIVAATTQQKPEFGQDKWSAGVRNSWGDDRFAINVDLDYSEAKGRGSAPDPNSWKLGAEIVKPLWKGTFGGDGVRASFSVAWELFDDVPSATHDDTAKVGLRLSIPVGASSAVKIPLSIVWANHEDLLSDADSVRGHIGITVDFGDALKKQSAAQ